MRWRRRWLQRSVLASEAGRCEVCESVRVRLACGTVNASHETERGEWVECDCGCGTEWRVDIEVDRDCIPRKSRATPSSGREEQWRSAAALALPMPSYRPFVHDEYLV